MRKLIIVFLSAFLFGSATVLATPRISARQDLKCAVETWGFDVSEDLENKVDKEVKRVLAVAKKEYGKDIKVSWGFNFDPYRPQVAGVTFTFGDINLIFFNPVYLNKYKDAFIKEVVIHEVAHAVTDEIYPDNKESHGVEWQTVMKRLGEPNPRRYHTFTFCANDYGRINLPIVPSFGI